MALLADPETVRHRTAICRACPHAVGPMQMKTFCTQCNCLLVVKVKFAGETCPAKKWSPSTGAKQ